jgi:putative oxidoreductase
MDSPRYAPAAEVGATVLRIALATMYLSHAWFKLGALGMPVTEQFFLSVGFPAWTAWVTVIAELVGGVALLAGWHARWIAPAMIPILAGALYVHWPNGWVFSGNGGGWEFPAYLVVLSLVQALIGDGAWALGAPGRASAPA